MRELRSVFLSWTRWGRFTSGSVCRALCVGFTRFVAFEIREALRNLPIEDEHLESMRKFEGIKATRRVLVIANGPSVNRIDAVALRQEMARGLDVVCMNDFFRSALSRIISPTIYVLSDPGEFDPEYLQTPESSVWAYLSERPEIELAIPARIDADLPTVPRYTFCDRPCYFSRGISILGRHSYIPMTAYRALALACFLGYSEILIIGFDNTHLLPVFGEGALRIRAQHFYDQDQVDSEAPAWAVEAHRYAHRTWDSWMFPDGTAGALEMQARAIWDARLFSRYPIFNLDEKSWTDAFPTIESSLVNGV